MNSRRRPFEGEGGRRAGTVSLPALIWKKVRHRFARFPADAAPLTAAMVTPDGRPGR
jgi:hypothetical protein